MFEAGKIEIGFREVPDPFDHRPVVVAVNARCDLVEYLLQRGVIDHAQFQAGRRFLFLVERAEGSQFLVCDPAKEPVDCSGARNAVPLFRLDAARQLDQVRRHLGGRDYHLARRHLCGDVNAYAEPTSRRDQDYQRLRVRDLLEDLGRFWGYIKPIDATRARGYNGYSTKNPADVTPSCQSKG